ncbi:MAG TPA: hypothetical protein O0X32_03210 [Methanocorpusculum sp.]|nr:hypothetical protein [Methanocorpusculum sp.]
MTIVTSSRKPTPEIRKLAKEIAFALGFPYVQRGKTGLRNFEDTDPKIIFLSGSKRKGVIFDLRINGEIVFSILITNIIITDRTTKSKKGFITREQDIFDMFSPHIPITLDKKADGPICFCGTQKKNYMFWIMM